MAKEPYKDPFPNLSRPRLFGAAQSSSVVVEGCEQVLVGLGAPARFMSGAAQSSDGQAGVESCPSETAIAGALMDAVLHGVGIMQDGKAIPVGEVFLSGPSEANAEMGGQERDSAPVESKIKSVTLAEVIKRMAGAVSRGAEFGVSESLKAGGKARLEDLRKAVDAIPATKVKRGRPPSGNYPEPWIAAGISRRTWFRRKRNVPGKQP